MLYACLETFEELKTDAPISHDNLDSAKKVRSWVCHVDPRIDLREAVDHVSRD